MWINYIQFLDHTRLIKTDTESDIESFCLTAHQTPELPYGICVYPWAVKTVCRVFKGTSVVVAAVANFPSGCETKLEIQQHIEEALVHGASEIDVVFPYSDYLSNVHRDQLLEHLLFVRGLCRKPIVMKVILEIDALPTTQHVQFATELSIQGGADFIKTSTGTIKKAPSLKKVNAILSVLKSAQCVVGLKISGGIHYKSDLDPYVKLMLKSFGTERLHPNTFRIGSSQLLFHLQ